MAVYPDCMKKAQAEIDQVVGRSRLPRFEDRIALPYPNAVLKEVLRWLPIAPQGVPHATITDDTYEGYYIPAGSIVIANTWKMLHDSETYSDPYTFRPERFIPEENGGIPERDPYVGSFGFGRRICAAMHLAQATLWITMASLLSAFEWSDPVDKDGQKFTRMRAVQPAREITQGNAQNLASNFNLVRMPSCRS